MTHSDLAKKLYEFCEQLLDETQKPQILKEDELFFRRIFFSRLYYALFHKVLNQSSTFQELSGPKQHQAIKDALEKKAKNQVVNKIYQKFIILRTLRVWADYKIDDNERAKKENLKRLLYNVKNIIGQNFSI